LNASWWYSLSFSISWLQNYEDLWFEALCFGVWSLIQ
jgi:hypothetical protein